MRFIFFTKTDWAEPPRLRHQLARLLADAGHEIVFFQCPYYPGQRIGKDDSGHASIQLYRYYQLLHHKLRLHPLLHRVNALFEKSQIRCFKYEFRIQRDDIIVNFNYDYFFLRDLFLENRLITIINDDFWSRAIGGYEKPLKWALEKTCRLSDVVLAVSLPLQKELRDICPAELFYPWADITYTPQDPASTRNTILFWGYINNKLDFNFISELASDLIACSSEYKLLFVGPIQCSPDTIRQITRHKNVRLLPAADLGDIDLTDVFVGLIPCRTGVNTIDAITLPNKALRILARGIPLAITGMPNFIAESFVFRLDQYPKSAVATLQAVHRQFPRLQPSIRDFVAANGPEVRLKQFLSCQ